MNLIAQHSLILLLLYTNQAIAAVNCTVPPLVLTIQNNTLSADGIALNRGVGLSLGGETQGLRLNFNRNNSGLRNSRDCENSSPTKVSQCRGASGGVFDVEDSKSFAAATIEDWKVPAPDPIPNGAHIVRGYDAAVFGKGITVPQFPFEVWSDAAASNRSALGFGVNSSVLSSFLDAGVVPSTEIGLYFGSRSIDKPDNGELIIGGYNTARVDGKFKDFPIGSSYGISEPCPLQVLLKDVQVIDKNGTARSIMADAGSRVPACINPVENAFTFTQAMYNTWANLTQHPANPPEDGSKNFTDQTYPLSSEPYMQELVIFLEGGYNTTIPHYELVAFERGNDARGLYAVTNTSRLASAITKGDTFTFPVLGGVFLSQNYLRIDYNRRVFSLAKAVTGPFGESQNNITSMCNAPPPVQIDEPPPPPPPPAKKLSGGAIAGIVIGSLAGTAGIILLGICLLRRRRSSSQNELGPGKLQDLSSTQSELPPRSMISSVEGSNSPFGVNPGSSSPQTTLAQAKMEGPMELDASPPGPASHLDASPPGPPLHLDASAPGPPPHLPEPSEPSRAQRSVRRESWSKMG